MLYQLSYEATVGSRSIVGWIVEWDWVSSEELCMEIDEGVEAKADNTLLDLHNSSDDTKAEFNNWFIIHSK